MYASGTGDHRYMANWAVKVPEGSRTCAGQDSLRTVHKMPKESHYYVHGQHTYIHWVVKLFRCWVQVDHMHHSFHCLAVLHNIAAVSGLRGGDINLSYILYPLTFPQPAGPITICPYRILASL